MSSPTPNAHLVHFEIDEGCLLNSLAGRETVQAGRIHHYLMINLKALSALLCPRFTLALYLHMSPTFFFPVTQTKEPVYIAPLPDSAVTSELEGTNARAGDASCRLCSDAAASSPPTTAARSA